MADEDRTVRVARALCGADGQSPGADHILHEVDEPRNCVRETVVPRWTVYDDEARCIVEAVRAMGLSGEVQRTVLR